MLTARSANNSHSYKRCGECVSQYAWALISKTTHNSMFRQHLRVSFHLHGRLRVGDWRGACQEAVFLVRLSTYKCTSLDQRLVKHGILSVLKSRPSIIPATVLLCNKTFRARRPSWAVAYSSIASRVGRLDLYEIGPASISPEMSSMPSNVRRESTNRPFGAAFHGTKRSNLLQFV